MSLPCTRSALLLATLTLATTATAETVEIKGARFPAALETEDRRYERIGHGLFRYMIWDAYAGAYYQAQGFPRPAPQSDVPRRLELEYFHAIEAEEFAEATRKSVREALDDATYAELASPLEAFNERYRDVAPGDRYALGWDGDRLTLALNGETLFEGNDPALANALFGIWLGEDPLGEAFRDDLLGR
ncbi:chalcone isomerase family protein [Halomonas rhizosphaerae]|uniref:Chalcone isomerase family protein n=1 Tax=Halomonas rhizosphaerae TaxID=3043296 RepID=A0ABT6UVR3_9GAMM|nr:chalcone isomerase family protein [Halomonas rhizosphaerae]MDI5890057.1 chalcone isomerase family protein [Halomonas rhizosphaerae]MDI5919426.1 chalcone isomerase family protein [Halomonas rhizosphaerae]